MPEPDPQDFYYPDPHVRPGEVICLHCLLTVKESNWQSLEEAAREHLTLCPFRDGPPRVRLNNLRARLDIAV